MNQFSDELGKTCYGPDSNVPSKPAGDDFIEKTADEYLVPGAEVTRNVKLVWMLTTRCGRVRLKIVEFDIHTKLGYCSVRPEIMKAIGHCRIPITLLTEKWKRVQPSKVGKYINETSTIAGRKCVIITQELRQMKSRYCVLQTDQFADVSETGRWFPGVVL